MGCLFMIFGRFFKIAVILLLLYFVFQYLTKGYSYFNACIRWFLTELQNIYWWMIP